MKRALSHPKRMEILVYLMQTWGAAGADEAELADSLGLTRAKVKYHLTVLHDADLISHNDEREPGATKRYIAAASAGT